MSNSNLCMCVTEFKEALHSVFLLSKYGLCQIQYFSQLVTLYSARYLICFLKICWLKNASWYWCIPDSFFNTCSICENLAYQLSRQQLAFNLYLAYLGLSLSPIIVSLWTSCQTGDARSPTGLSHIKDTL